MKSLILTFWLSLTILSCRVQTHYDKSTNVKTQKMFEILRIDLIENNYIIYAKRNDSVFKITSTKKDTLPCLQIKQGNFYNLKIKSVFSPNFHQKFDIAGVKYNGSMVKLERNNGVVWDLFVAENLKGLCYFDN